MGGVVPDAARYRHAAPGASHLAVSMPRSRLPRATIDGLSTRLCDYVTQGKPFVKEAKNEQSTAQPAQNPSAGAPGARGANHPKSNSCSKPCSKAPEMAAREAFIAWLGAGSAPSL